MDSSREDERKIDSPPNDLTHIVKGKRTKRQRPQSPTPFNIPDVRPDNVSNDNSTTEEDEDTAKCLLLLSQGPSPDSDSPNITLNYKNYYYNHKQNENEDEFVTACYKFTSKRYIETSTDGNGKVGMYVYECKTCKRTFPSFQALGGHRASHKKPKLGGELERKRLISDDEELQFKTNIRLSNQLGHKAFAHFINNKSLSKVHECAICGAEFTSGQALGGHMRRHRGTAMAAGGGGGGGGGGANTTLSLSPTSTPIGVTRHFSAEEINDDNRSKKERIGFFLDLNLPAVPEPEDNGVNHDHHDLTEVTAAENFQMQHHRHRQQQQQQQQQSPIVLSAAPALVDCHY